MRGGVGKICCSSGSFPMMSQFLVRAVLMDLDSKWPVYSVLKTRGGLYVLFGCGLLCLSKLGLSACETCFLILLIKSSL